MKKEQLQMRILKSQLKQLIMEVLHEEAPARDFLPIKHKLPKDPALAELNLRIYEIIAGFIDSDLQQKIQATPITNFVEDFGIRQMAQAIKDLRFNIK